MATTGAGAIRDEARSLLPDLVDLRRRLHRRPETGLVLPETQAAIVAALDGLGLEVTPGTGCSSLICWNARSASPRATTAPVRSPPPTKRLLGRHCSAMPSFW